MLMAAVGAEYEAMIQKHARKCPSPAVPDLSSHPWLHFCGKFYWYVFMFERENIKLILWYFWWLLICISTLLSLNAYFFQNVRYHDICQQTPKAVLVSRADTSYISKVKCVSAKSNQRVKTRMKKSEKFAVHEGFLLDYMLKL
jgi:hypothetical protein